MAPALLWFRRTCAYLTMSRRSQHDERGFGRLDLWDTNLEAGTDIGIQ